MGKGEKKTVAQQFSIEEITSLLNILKENGVTEFELKRGDEKISLKRGIPQVNLAAAYSQQIPAPIMVAMPPTQAAGDDSGHPAAREVFVANQPMVAQAPSAITARASNSKPVKSPMVGTFYGRSSPDAEPFVQVGDIVKKGDVLCIVEAMKIMNEIESDQSGRIVKVCLDDGQMVEFGEVLFQVEPA